MFAGHVGAGLAFARVDRRVNVAVFCLAAMLLDAVLWAFVLLGWESVIVPADYASTHFLHFSFPYSHGLLASLGWSALAGAVAFVWYPGLSSRKVRGALAVAAVVFSHWILDALVHVPELPVIGAGSAQVGLGLWKHMPFVLSVEGLILAAGLWLFLPGARLSRPRKAGLAALGILTLVFTVLGMTVAAPPPSILAMAAISLLTIGVLCALAYWLGRPAAGATKE